MYAAETPPMSQQQSVTTDIAGVESDILPKDY